MKKFIVLLIVGLISSVGLCAPKNSPWREVQCVEIPAGTTINHGTTSKGNPKAWIEIEGVKVSVSPSNAQKFEAGQVKLELVKWYNDTTKKYKYSTRQVKSGTSSSTSGEKNVDISKVFK